MAIQITDLPIILDLDRADEMPMVQTEVTYKMTLGQLIDTIYPVGSIYQSAIDNDPTNFIGGVWERFAQGKILVNVDDGDSDFGTIEQTGGEKTHTLITAEMASHSHSQFVTANAGSSARSDYVDDGSFASYTQNVETGSNGSGGSHNNLMPYTTAYMWKRTA